MNSKQPVSMHQDSAASRHQAEPLRTDMQDHNEALSQQVIAQSDVLKKLSMALSQLNEGVFITEDKHNWEASKIVYANAAMYRITGYSPEELYDRTPGLFYGVMTDAAALERMQESLAREQAHLGELIEYRKDGTPFLAELFVRPLFGLGEDSSYFIGILRDITERKRIELELRHKIEFNNNIINTSPTIVLLLDIEGKILRFNPAFENLTGWNLSEAQGHDWFDTFVPELDRKRIKQQYQEALENNQAQVYVHPIVTKTGEQREVEWAHTLLTDLTGARIGLLFNGQDITERKRTMEALNESEHRLRAILETAADAIITIDKRGTIDSVNSATAKMFGYSSDELLGQNVKILMPSPFTEEHDGYLRQYLETREAKIIGKGREAIGKRKDGSVFPMDLAVSEVDHLGLFTGIIRDISDRHATQQKLLESERLAAIGEAMAGLAHESRNALQRAQACLDLLKLEVADNPESIALIQSIQQANDDLYQLYQEVRAFAAPVVIRPKTLDITKVFQHAWHDLAELRRRRLIQLEQRVHCENLELELDSFAMSRVFRNILENAVQACSDPVLIQVEFHGVELDGQPALAISIRDNGPGIPPAAAARVFDSFFTTRQDGTGLGLAISQRVVKAHGGQIVVTLDCPSGAEFVITIPRRQPPKAGVNSLRFLS